MLIRECLSNYQTGYKQYIETELDRVNDCNFEKQKRIQKEIEEARLPKSVPLLNELI